MAGNVAALGHAPRLTAMLRSDERVTPLELFFDLVFVLALTQCTALMAREPTWTGFGKGLVVIGMLWWSWVGYAWLTSVLDPEEGAVRIAIFAAMAAFLVAALAIPHVFGNGALVFALAYGVVRVAHIVLFRTASRDDPELRHAVYGLGFSTAIGVGLLLVASATDGPLQGALWGLALVLDAGGPLVIDPAGWKLVPEHFAERHGLIFLIALGESIVAIGVGADRTLSAGVIVGAVLGVVVAATQWWLYFDVVALVASRRLAREPDVRRRNAMARDSYSYLHFVLVAGIALVAVGIKKVLGHVGDPLDVVPATALLGGAALYLVGHVAFRLRNVGSFNRQRAVVAVVLVALIPLATAVSATVTLAIVAGLHVALIAYEATHFADARNRIRHELDEMR